VVVFLQIIFYLDNLHYCQSLFKLIYTHTCIHIHALVHTLGQFNVTLGVIFKANQQTPRGEDFFTISHLVLLVWLDKHLAFEKEQNKSRQILLLSPNLTKIRAPVPLEMFDAPELEWIWP